MTSPAARSEAEQALPGEAAVAAAAHRSLAGDARGIHRILPFLGPAFVAAVAYIDPGNFATNISGGAKFGYLLLWIVLAANLVAMLVQTQSAKLGIATGKNLAELCRERFSRRASIGLWLQAEVVAMACDLAEIVGAALGLNLLFGIPLFPAGLIAGAGTFALLALQRRGFRKLEAAITVLVGVVVAAFAYEPFDASPDGSEVAKHLFVPGFAGTESILLATGIVGATVMPHVIYLHSALTQNRIVGRNDRERYRILRFEKIDVVIALAIAGAVNISMMVVAAALFHGGGLTGIETIEGAYTGLQNLSSQGAATIFGVALLASGFASSSVGTMAGQVVMQGFIHRRIPIFLRRAITLAPALFVLAIGVNPTDALVGSQVVLSFGIPFALVPLVMFAAKREVMGALVNPRWLTVLASVLAAMIIALNVFLLYEFVGLTEGGSLPRTMALADDFQRILDALPPDWTDLEVDLRIDDESRYIDCAVFLSQVNAQVYNRPREWHWRLIVAHSFGHAAAAETVLGVLAKIDAEGVGGEMLVAEVREGRSEVVQMWGRPESVREEFRQRRSI